MLLRLRKKFTLLYTFTAGLILTVVVFSLALVTQQSDNRQKEDLFNRQLMTLANKLQYDSRISQQWLGAMESENRMIIYIEEKNTPLLFPGTYHPATERDELVSRARSIARTESVDTTVPPISTDLKKSSLFTVQGTHGDEYLGTVLIFSASKSYFSLILLQDITISNQMVWLRYLLFLLADLGGILCFLFMSWRFVGKSLQPIRENEEKQHAFIAAASHELRSPLAVIRASTAAIESEPERKELFLSNIEGECDRMSRLIQDLLLLASAKSNTWTLKKEAVDMDTLLLTLYERYEPLCRNKNLTLLLDLPEDTLPAVSGDGERIAHILSILLDNAISYSPAGSPVTLRAFLSRQSLYCSVIDHGPGIPVSEREKIFAYFYRSDTSRKDKNHFGLGLCVASELTRLLGFTLTLTDTPGGGCSFSLRMPV